MKTYIIPTSMVIEAPCGDLLKNLAGGSPQSEHAQAPARPISTLRSIDSLGTIGTVK